MEKRGWNVFGKNKFFFLVHTFLRSKKKKGCEVVVEDRWGGRGGGSEALGTLKDVVRGCLRCVDVCARKKGREWSKRRGQQMVGGGGNVAYLSSIKDGVIVAI